MATDMMPPLHSMAPPHFARTQQGAALYVALVMLILLAIIGLVAMRVSGLQERMSASYRNINVAFQAAERDAREIETSIGSALNSGGSYNADSEECTANFDPLTWSNGQGVSQKQAKHVRRIDRCFPSSSIVIGRQPQNRDTGNIYEITVLSSNALSSNASATDASGASTAVINTIYVP